MVAHALVLPTEDPEERQRHDAETEAIGMQLARAHEEAAGASVHDVSRPDLARRAGLTDWPGFDLRSLRPAGVHGPAEERAIEVKGRAGPGSVEVLANEWAKAAICATATGSMSCSTAPRRIHTWSRCRTRSAACSRGPRAAC